QLIRRRAPFTIVEKLAILEDLCAALHYAHTAGIVHRDIKPANVMLEDVSGTVKVLDFGIARAGESGLTHAGDMVGTLNYMSPEQIAGSNVDHRTDVYAVGVLAYELLSYRRAFPGTIQDGALFRILNTDPDPLDLLVPDVDTAIEPVVAGAMAKEPAKRYQDLEQLHHDIADVRDRLIALGVGGEGVPAAALDADAVTVLAHAEGSGTAPQPTPTPGKTFRERPLSSGRGSSSIRRGTSPSASRARGTAPGTGRQIEASGGSPSAVAAWPRPWKVFVAIAVAAGLMGVVTIALNGIGSWSLRPAVAVQPLPSPPHAAPSEAPTKTSAEAPTTTTAAPVPGLAGGPA